MTILLRSSSHHGYEDGYETQLDPSRTKWTVGNIDAGDDSDHSPIPQRLASLTSASVVRVSTVAVSASSVRGDRGSTAGSGVEGGEDYGEGQGSDSRFGFRHAGDGDERTVWKTRLNFGHRDHPGRKERQQ